MRCSTRHHRNLYRKTSPAPLCGYAVPLRRSQSTIIPKSFLKQCQSKVSFEPDSAAWKPASQDGPGCLSLWRAAGLSEQSETRLGLQNRQDRIDCFLDPDCFHAAEIDWAFPEEARAAFDLMSQNNVVIAEWSGETRLGRAKNRHDRNSKQRSEMHCARVICQQ